MKRISMSVRPRRRPHVRSAALDAEMLLYEPTRKTAIRLNESAATVWRLCDGSRSVAELIVLLGATYPETSAVGAEVEATVVRMTSEGVLDVDEFERHKSHEGAAQASSRRARGRSVDRGRPVSAWYGRRSITFAGSSISIEYDAEGEGLVGRLFHAMPGRRSAAARSRVRVGCGRDAGALAVHCDDSLVYEGNCRETAAFLLLDTIQRRLAEQSRGGVLLHAAAVARRRQAILIPGPSRAGKSSLAAWLTRNGFDLLGDELSFIRMGATRVEGFTTPVTIKEDGRDVLDGWLVGGNRPAPNPTARLLVAPERLNPDTVRRPAELALVLLPNYANGAECEIEALSKADAAVQLIGSLTNASALPDNGFDEIVRLAKIVPAYSLRYSDFAQLSRSLGPLLAARVGE